jgi:hypothetical protein
VYIPKANNKNPTCEIELKASNLLTLICDSPAIVPINKDNKELINNRFFICSGPTCTEGRRKAVLASGVLPLAYILKLGHMLCNCIKLASNLLFILPVNTEKSEKVAVSVIPVGKFSIKNLISAKLETESGNMYSINPCKNIKIVNFTIIVSQTVTIVGVPSYTSGAH